MARPWGTPAVPCLPDDGLEQWGPFPIAHGPQQVVEEGVPL